MTREVIMMSRAENQLYEAMMWWAENRSTEQAIRWMEGFVRAIRHLAQDALRSEDL